MDVVHRNPAIHPIGEQDGESERYFKAKLRELFAASTPPRAAWLVRARLDDDKTVKIVLALATESSALVASAQKLFHVMFRTDQTIDVVQVTAQQEAEIAAAAPAFYENTQPAARSILGKLKELFGVSGRS